MYSKAYLLTATTFITGVFGASISIPRSTQISAQHGTLVEPTGLTTVLSGVDFSFDYLNSNWCHDGYSPISVWLTDYQPTGTDVNATSGTFDEGKFTYFFGNFLIPNFGIPVLPGSTPPPPTLTMPDLSGQFSAGGTLFLSVIETARDCPPGNVPPQYGLTEAALVMG
ncbi:hypothetical protein D9758_008782 [Tetrapyrgos nigripes]|uniref:Uncharacterized protein n=1 Tax=Tetrapyrgos nigripes TaxID=182062 RepID=A0A8H5FY70_9AGAR|nr:hypothetical protein D9758_008782 [Tetrapyrgos nigripes]